MARNNLTEAPTPELERKARTLRVILYMVLGLSLVYLALLVYTLTYRHFELLLLTGLTTLGVVAVILYSQLSPLEKELKSRKK